MKLNYQEASVVKSAVMALDGTGADCLINFEQDSLAVTVLSSGLIEVRDESNGSESHADLGAFTSAYALEDFQPGLLALVREIDAMCEWRLEDATLQGDHDEQRTWERIRARCRAAIAAPRSDSASMRGVPALAGYSHSPQAPVSAQVFTPGGRPLNLTRQQAAAVKSAMVATSLSGGKIEFEFGQIEVYVTAADWLTIRGGPHGFEEHRDLDEFTARYGLDDRL